MTPTRNGTEQELATKKAYKPRNPPTRDQAASADGAHAQSTANEALQRLEERQETLIQNVGKINDSIIMMSATIQRLLDAATQQAPKSDLADALQSIADHLLKQQEALTTIDKRLLALPDLIVEALTTE